MIATTSRNNLVEYWRTIGKIAKERRSANEGERPATSVCAQAQSKVSSQRCNPRRRRCGLPPLHTVLDSTGLSMVSTRISETEDSPPSMICKITSPSFLSTWLQEQAQRTQQALQMSDSSTSSLSMKHTTRNIPGGWSKVPSSGR